MALRGAPRHAGGVLGPAGCHCWPVASAHGDIVRESLRESVGLAAGAVEMVGMGAVNAVDAVWVLLAQRTQTTSGEQGDRVNYYSRSVACLRA